MKHTVLISKESLSLNEFVDQNQCEGDKYTLFVCLRIVVSNTCVVLLFFFFLLPVSLDCPFLIAPSVFSNVYL